MKRHVLIPFVALGIIVMSSITYWKQNSLSERVARIDGSMLAAQVAPAPGVPFIGSTSQVITAGSKVTLFGQFDNVTTLLLSSDPTNNGGTYSAPIYFGPSFESDNKHIVFYLPYNYSSYGGPVNVSVRTQDGQVSNAQTLTITPITQTSSAPSLSVSGDSSGTIYRISPSGRSGVTAATYRFMAKNDSINLQRIALRLNNTGSSTPNDLVGVHVFDGNVEVGSAVFTTSNYYATTTLSVPVLLTKDVSKILTVKVDLSPICKTCAVTKSGHLVSIDVNPDDKSGTYGTGVNSGLRVNATGSTYIAGTGIRVFRSIPVVIKDTITNPSGLTANVPLLRFKVTADGNGPINISQLGFSMATSSVIVRNINVYAFNDSAYSQPISGVNDGGKLMTEAVKSGSPDFFIYPQFVNGIKTHVQVATSSTMYFEVRAATVLPLSATYSVNTTLKGTDKGFIGMLPASNVVDNFVWSPNSTANSYFYDYDWTNGYGLPSLPLTGISQLRSN